MRAAKVALDQFVYVPFVFFPAFYTVDAVVRREEPVLLAARALVFKVRSTSFMDRGADLTFLSAFPAEQEFLFPPLTFLEPTGDVETVRASAPPIFAAPRETPRAHPPERPAAADEAKDADGKSLGSWFF